MLDAHLDAYHLDLSYKSLRNRYTRLMCNQPAMQIYVGYNQIVQHLPWNPQFVIVDSLTA